MLRRIARFDWRGVGRTVAIVAGCVGLGVAYAYVLVTGIERGWW